MAIVQLIKNIGLDDSVTGTQTSTVNEPTVATADSGIFYTCNWAAASSANNGDDWKFVDPFTTLPSAANGFCCDQMIVHDPSRDIWIWILQYIAVPGGNNVFRVAVAPGASPDSWHWWDFSPVELDSSWTDLWFDYPDAALSNNHLYVTFNVFNSGDRFQRAVAFKLPLDALSAGSGLTYQWWTTVEHGSLRLTQGATDSMFFASHNGGRMLRVHGWPDSSNTVGSFDVQVNPWSSGPYSSTGPDGAEWLGRVDSRITGGWVSGTRAGFLWTAAPRSGRPVPYVKGAVVDVTTQLLVEEPDIWNAESAFAYPAACPNAAGVVGVSLAFGGGPRHPAHVVGFRDGGEWRLSITRDSTDGPADGSWGDYVSCHRHHPNSGEWVASGVTLQGGNARRNVEPQYVHFGIGS
ncbi:hypothetical protein BN159_7440 [Streptomyces davaonensis JCM 4913]|uniref:Uncharacterized protein n=1 Tax=Streptomyces davaonensis (strain DSM 101723 / JCM 4913 / KCC S-0913 / 768) TaxID=1214101 RepID=K4RFG9_STRDJ|nr:hypothetical protein [Streptomyces davaonensis]CCK31819.1 hypothetical protein BN159_7440 [Streptomyces davaonensis JCM 4913]